MSISFDGKELATVKESGDRRTKSIRKMPRGKQRVQQEIGRAAPGDTPNLLLQALVLGFSWDLGLPRIFQLQPLNLEQRKDLSFPTQAEERKLYGRPCLHFPLRTQYSIESWFMHTGTESVLLGHLAGPLFSLRRAGVSNSFSLGATSASLLPSKGRI